MKENSIENLKERLEELYRIQDARIGVGADDLDIREDIAETEAEIAELEEELEENNNTDTNVGDIEEDIEILENWLKELNELFNKTHINNTKERKALEHILSDYKRVLEENKKLKNDIANMYDEEVIISIIRDNFNLSRNEVLELLGGD